MEAAALAVCGGGTVVKCVQCERLRTLAATAARAYYGLVADLECAYLGHDEEAPLLLSKRLERASHERDAARAELLNHESQAHKKPVDSGLLSKRESA
jgi:hypothetical protein